MARPNAPCEPDDAAAAGTGGPDTEKPTTITSTRPDASINVRRFCVHLPALNPPMLMAVSTMMSEAA